MAVPFVDSPQQGLWRPFNAIASAAYYLGLNLDRFWKKLFSTSLPKPVISIGNLTVGGTGKTPLVLRLADDMVRWGLFPGILTRGYTGLFESPAKAIVSCGEPPSQSLSDESELMAIHVKKGAIGVGANRIQSAKTMVDRFPIDGFILDDGFQHWRLNRDLDIVCVDVTDPFGGGHLIPWGRLREPLNGIQRAHLIVLTRTELIAPELLSDIKKWVNRMAPNAALVTTSFIPELVDSKGNRSGLNHLKNKKVNALSAIGNPSAFERLIKNAGGEIRSVRFRDHYRYTANDLTQMAKTTLENGALWVTTEKDWVKLKRFAGTKHDSWLSNVFRIQMTLQMERRDVPVWENILKSVLNVSV